MPLTHDELAAIEARGAEEFGQIHQDYKVLVAEIDRLTGERGMFARLHGEAEQQVKALLQRLDAAGEQLTLLHEGEQPYEDERLVPTPAQWIWRWNRATPERRLEMAAALRPALDERDRYDRALRRIAERCPVRSKRHRPDSFCSSEVARAALAGSEVTGG